MNQMFEALGIGLAVAVFVILVLLTAYFQSPRLAIISISAVPGVLAGIVVMLYFSKTTLNIESFMGSIMCIGVSVSNSVMMVTFMDEHWKAGKPSTEAAIQGGTERLRPILMTACAMSIGMVPMALALERGSQMEAPLGRAVIGGLVMSTFATLLVLPAIFAVVIGKKQHTSPSLYPGNPESAHHDPEFGGGEGGEGGEEGEDGRANGKASRGQRKGDRKDQEEPGGDQQDGQGEDRRKMRRPSPRRPERVPDGENRDARPTWDRRSSSPRRGRRETSLGATPRVGNRSPPSGRGSGSWPPSPRRAAARRRRRPRASWSRRPSTWSIPSPGSSAASSGNRASSRATNAPRSIRS